VDLPPETTIFAVTQRCGILCLFFHGVVTYQLSGQLVESEKHYTELLPTRMIFGQSPYTLNVFSPSDESLASSISPSSDIERSVFESDSESESESEEEDESDDESTQYIEIGSDSPFFLPPMFKRRLASSPLDMQLPTGGLTFTCEAIESYSGALSSFHEDIYFFSSKDASHLHWQQRMGHGTLDFPLDPYDLEDIVTESRQ